MDTFLVLVCHIYIFFTTVAYYILCCEQLIYPKNDANPDNAGNFKKVQGYRHHFTCVQAGISPESLALVTLTVPNEYIDTNYLHVHTSKPAQF